MTSEFSESELKKMSQRDRAMLGVYDVPGNPNAREEVEKRQGEIEPLDKVKNVTDEAKRDGFGQVPKN